MYDLYNNPVKAFPNRQWRGCFDCNYNDLCTAQSRGEDNNFNAILASSYTIRPPDEEESEIEEEAA